MALVPKKVVRAGRGLRQLLAAAPIALVVLVQLWLASADPVAAGDPQTFFRIEHFYLPVEMYVSPAVPVGAELHLSTGPADRGRLSVGVLLADGRLSPNALTILAAEGQDVSEGQTFTDVVLVGSAAVTPGAPAGSCPGMRLVVEELTTAPDGLVATLAVHASCPDFGRAFEARIASGIPFADYTTNWLNFAGPYPGDAETKTITVTSTGSGPLVMSDIWIEDTEWTEHPAANPSTEYTVASETCTTAPVAPGDTCTIDVRYVPLGTAVFHPARISASVNTAGGLYSEGIGGAVTSPIGAPGGHDFGSLPEMVTSPAHRFTYTVAGGSPRTFGPVVIDGREADSFAIVEDTCTAAPVPGGASCHVDVAFRPHHLGSAGARLLMHGDAWVEWREAMLQGVGTSPISAIPRVEFGYQPPGGVYTRTVTITSVADAPLDFLPFTRLTYAMQRNPDRLSIESETCTAAPLPPRGSCTVTFAFAPDAAAPPDTWSEQLFLVHGDGWDAPAGISVSGIANVPLSDGQDNPPPVISVDPYVSTVTEGTYVRVYGTYSDPRGLVVIMPGAGSDDRWGWNSSPKGRWMWAAHAVDGPGEIDAVLTASNALATSAPVHIHITILNAPPYGTITGPHAVPAGGTRTFVVMVGDPGQDLVSVTPSCGTGTVISYLRGSLLCSFVTPGTTSVGVTAVDTSGATTRVQMNVLVSPQVRDRSTADIVLDSSGAGVVRGLVLVDLDGDGSKEIVTRPVGTGVAAWYTVLLDTPAPGITMSAGQLPPHGYRILPAPGTADRNQASSSAGDVNGDGIEDLLVGASATTARGRSQSGSAWVVYGGRSTDLDLGAMTPEDGFRIDGRTEYSWLGDTVAGGGDINGDGYDDIVLGAHGDPDHAWGDQDLGAAYVVFGGPSMVDLDLADAPAGRWAEIDLYGDNGDRGAAVAVGDVDGDGYADVVSGGSVSMRGGIFVSWGSPEFHDQVLAAGSSAQWTQLTDGIYQQSSVMVGAALGYKMVVADVDGDGCGDIVAGFEVIDSKLVMVFHGEHDRVLRREGVVTAESTRALMFRFVAAAGDMDGDGRADIVVGGTDMHDYRAVVAGGQLVGAVNLQSANFAWLRVDDRYAPWTPSEWDLSIPAIGDVNGDGVADLVLGGTRDIAIFLGSPDRLAPAVTSPAVSLIGGSTVSRASVAVRVGWGASDASSGVRDSTVWVSLDQGASRKVTVTTNRAIRAAATPGHRYRWLVRARDWAGNASARVASTTFPVIVASDDAQAFHWTGTWSRSAGTRYLDAQVHAAATPGAAVSYQFRGRSIGWVTTRRPGGGKATVYIDGARVAIVDLAGPLAYRRMAFARSWAAAGTHTIRIVVAGGGRVDVDGLVVLQ